MSGTNMARASRRSTRRAMDPLTRLTKSSSTTSSGLCRHSRLFPLTPGLRTLESFLRLPKPTLSLSSKPSQRSNSVMRLSGTVRKVNSTKPGTAITPKDLSPEESSTRPHQLDLDQPVPPPASNTFRRALRRLAEVVRLLSLPTLPRRLSTVRLLFSLLPQNNS